MLRLLLFILSVPVWGHVTDSSTGKGIPGVVVSDGYSCTLTDEKGAYRLDADSLARTVNVTIPSAYEIPLGRDGRPAFFQYIDGTRKDFCLIAREDLSERFTLLAVADAHLRDPMNFKRLRKESIPDIRRTAARHSGSNPVIAVGLGDQLWDEMPQAGKARKAFSGIRTKAGRLPFFYTIGNHDHDNKGGKDEYAVTEHFVRNFGPTDYSFDMGKVHVVVMDDIRYTGTQKDGIKISYTTGIDDRQLEWLRQDLALVENKNEKAVVFCVHAPMFGRFSHKDDVRDLLCGFHEAHALSGHEHNINNVRHGGVIEHNIQSLCGAWWYSNLSPGGSPLGYGVFTFDGARMVEEYNKASTESEDFQMRVYDGNDSYNDKTPYTLLKGEAKRDRVYGWPEELAGCFVVRVWDGTPDWEVKFVQNGIEIPMEQTKVKFFDACSCAYMVDVFGGPYGGSSIYKAMVDSFWVLKAPCGDPAAETDWEIVATHHMPSGETRTYSSKHLMRDYRGFATGTHYLR